MSAIANFFANLSDPQKRLETVKGVGKSFGLNITEDKNTPLRGGLRDFATAMSGEVYDLGQQVGLGVKPQADYVPREEKKYTTPKEVFLAELRKGGLPEHVVAGFEMNGHDESGFDPTVYGDGGNAVGILQWNGPRMRALKAFADERGMKYNDPRLQAQFTLHELQTSERGAYDKMMATTTPGEAGAAIVNYFERPAESHRARREAEYLGYRSGAPMEHTSEGLSFGEELDAVDPMSEEYVGRTAEAPLSMGMDPVQFETLKEQYDERTAMEILNNTQNPNTNYPVYPDAILRLLEQEDEPTAAEQQAETLANGGIDIYGAGGYSMGYETPEPATAGAAGSGGGASGSPSPEAPPATVSTKGAEEAAPKLTKMDKLLNMLYGTAVEDMSDDERADRRRAMGMALTEGFQMLSRGTPMDIQGIVGQRMELQQVRRAAADLKKNAQGVSDMLVASGLPELAQLPFSGEAGMNAAMSALINEASKTAPAGSASFDLPPAVRATMAQTMADMGQGGLAEQFMTMPPGEGLEILYREALGTQTTPPQGGDKAVPFTPEQREQFAMQFEAANNPFVAQAIRSGLDDATISKMIEEQGKVAPDVQTAVDSAAGTAAVQAASDAEDAVQYASGLEAAGFPPEIVEAARRSGSETAAKEVVSKAVERGQAENDRAAIKARGEAVAKLVPDDLPNAEALREAARTAETSQDLAPVYEAIAGATPEEKLYRLAQQDPNFMPFLSELVRNRAGMERKLSFGERKIIGEMDIVAERMAASRLAASKQRVNSETLRQILANPDFNPGKLQGKFVVPLQQWANSIMGEAAPKFASDMDLTGTRIFETMMAETFVAASEGLKGAISDKETAAFMATATTMTDEKTVALAQLQYRDRIVEIQQAEYNAMLEWAEQAEKDGTLGDRQAMIDYVNNKVKDMRVFDQVNEEDVDEWLETADLEIGEVFEVVREDGSSFLVPFIP